MEENVCCCSGKGIIEHGPLGRRERCVKPYGKYYEPVEILILKEKDGFLNMLAQKTSGLMTATVPTVINQISFMPIEYNDTATEYSIGFLLCILWDALTQEIDPEFRGQHSITDKSSSFYSHFVNNKCIVLRDTMGRCFSIAFPRAPHELTQPMRFVLLKIALSIECH